MNEAISADGEFLIALITKWKYFNRFIINSLKSNQHYGCHEGNNPLADRMTNGMPFLRCLPPASPSPSLIMPLIPASLICDNPVTEIYVRMIVIIICIFNKSSLPLASQSSTHTQIKTATIYLSRKWNEWIAWILLLKQTENRWKIHNTFNPKNVGKKTVRQKEGEPVNPPCTMPTSTVGFLSVCSKCKQMVFVRRWQNSHDNRTTNRYQLETTTGSATQSTIEYETFPFQVDNSSQFGQHTFAYKIRCVCVCVCMYLVVRAVVQPLWSLVLL